MVSWLNLLSVWGKERDKHNSKEHKATRGAVGTAAVVDMKDRDSDTVSAAVVGSTDKLTFQGFMLDQVANQA